MDRRNFIKSSAIFGGALAALGPFQALSARRAMGNTLPQSEGHGPLVNKGHLWLPNEFNYQIISVSGTVMNDGQLTPGIFVGMAAYPGPNGNTNLIRNHENREQSGEIKVQVPEELQYNVAARGGNTKLEVRRERTGRDLEKFFGIDPNFTGDMSTDEYLDDLRGETTEDYLKRLSDE